MARRWPIRVRLTLWYVLLLALILAAFSSGICLALRDALYDNLDDALETRSIALQGLIASAGPRPSGTTLQSLMADPRREGEQYVRIYDTTGAVALDTSGPAGEVQPPAAAVRRALAGSTTRLRVTVDGDPFRVRVDPLYRDGVVDGVLEVGQTEEDVADTLRALVLIVAVAYPITLGAASSGGIFLARRALAPIDRVTRLARRISAADLGQRLALDLPDDEVGRLARTFDDMIARLDAAFQRQRQFTADASHELRTPLTAIKGQVEVVLGRPRDAAAYREVLAAINEDVDRLIRLVGSLLALARADAGQIPLAREPVAIPELVAAAIEQVAPLADQHGLRLTVAPGQAVQIEADADLLLQLLLNLLDNACKHTPPGGAVTAGWNIEHGRMRLWVRDTGPGIAAEHLPHLFERFYRVDTARSRTEGGTGLGLSICRWIAEAHGGSVTVESTPGHGSLFSAVIPLRRASPPS